MGKKILIDFILFIANAWNAIQNSNLAKLHRRTQFKPYDKLIEERMYAWHTLQWIYRSPNQLFKIFDWITATECLELKVGKQYINFIYLMTALYVTEYRIHFKKSKNDEQWTKSRKFPNERKTKIKTLIRALPHYMEVWIIQLAYMDSVIALKCTIVQKRN